MKHSQNERMLKNVINEEIKKILEVETLFWTFGISMQCYYGDNGDQIQTSFKTLVLRICIKNNVFQLSHGIKTFIEASSTNNIQTWEKVFCSCCF